MKENIMKYINELEGFKTCIKNSHWSASNMNIHKLFDDIADTVSEIQDKVAEISQGLYGKIQKNELKPVSCEMSTDKEFLSKLLKSTEDFYSTIKEGEDYIGLRSEIENFIGEIQKFQYLMNLCIVENKITENVLQNLKNGTKFALQMKNGDVVGATKTALTKDKMSPLYNADEDEIKTENKKHIKQIYISESAKQRLFNESALMDKERGKNARAFRTTLKKALETNSYEFDPATNKLYIDGFSYELGKKFAEDNNGEPIPLHYTFNSVNKYIMDMLN